jgi:glycosyltransferase involved in cell wall biosynthesis
MNSEDALVTIAVPTFDRPEALRRCVAGLLKEWTADFRILIVDNCSRVPAADVLRDVLAARPEARVNIIRNAANVGGVANVLRCFELATTEWVWVLGDDDLIQPGALARVKDTCREYPSAACVTFASGLLQLHGVQRKARVVTHDLGEFIEGIDDFSGLLFLSASLYRRAELIPGLRTAYLFADCFAPHLCLLLARLRAGPAECVFHDANIVSWQPLSPDEKWDSSIVNRGLCKLIELIDDARLRGVLFEKICRVHALPLPWWKTLVYWSVLASRNELAFLRDLFLHCSRVRLLAGERVVAHTALGLAAFSLLASSAPLLRLPLRAYLRLKHGADYRPEIQFPNYTAAILKGKRY